MDKREEIAASPIFYTKCSKLSAPELNWFRSIASTLLCDSTVKWRHNGQGLLQAYMHHKAKGFEARVHIWHDELRKPGIIDNGLGHDHRFDMTSYVILGGIRHHEYILEPCHESDSGASRLLECTHAREAKLQGDYHMEPVHLDGYVRTHAEGFNIEDSKYEFPKFRFHQAMNLASPTVTIVLKSNQTDDKARILDQFSKRPLVNSFENSKGKEEFKHILRDTCEKLWAANDG